MKSAKLTTLTRVILLTAFYFIGGLVGKEASFMMGQEASLTQERVVLVWPPAGIALAAILLFGYHFWPGVALGAILFSLLNGMPLGFFTLGTAIGNTVGALVCAFLLERLIQFKNSMERVRDTVGFICLACFLGTTVNAAFNMVSLCYAGEVPWNEMLPSMVEWWVPNMMAGLVVSPFILAWGSRSSIEWDTRRIVEAVLCGVGLLASTFTSFNSYLVEGLQSYPYAFLPVPFLIWSALRFSHRGATTGTLLVSGMAIYQLLQQRGPFWTGTNMKESLMLIGSYIGVLAVTNLLLAAEATQRELAERAVRASEKRYRAVVEDQTEMICRFRPDGRPTFVNEAYCRFHGQTSEQLLGAPFLPLLSQETRQFLVSRMASLTAEHPVMSHDYEVQTPDGQSLWQECAIRQLVDELNQTVEFQAVVQDITERKRAEEALRKSEEMFQLISDNVSDLIAVTDAEGKRLYNSPSYKKTFGAMEALSGKDAFAQIHPEDRDRVRKVFLETLQTGVGQRIEYRFLLVDGSVRYIESQGNFVRGDAGQLSKIVSIGRDITERRQIQEDLAKARDVAVSSARLKAEFLANMSHEIRTPINGVIGMTNLLLHTQLNKQQRDFAETTRASADALLAIINDILDFSKIEAGKLSFEILDFDLRDVVEGTLELLVGQAEAKGLELAGSVPAEVPTRLRGDPGRLRQVLTNLVSNAIKFTERGEVIVRVSTESETDAHVELRFEVRDTGIGISPEAQSRLFQAFSQADGSTTRKYGGTGLGLAISKQLVEKMRGEVGVQSGFRKGSTFWFTVQLEKQPAAALAAAPVQHDLANVRVLIVDDNATNRQLLHHQATFWRMRNDSAASGLEALAALRQAVADGDPYDLAILDMFMPQMDGLMLARLIKSEPVIAGTRLIMLTSLTQQPNPEVLKAAGIEDSLSKPVKQSRLFDCLTTVMSRAAGQPADTARPAAPGPVALAAASGRSSLKPRILVAEDNTINQKVALSQLEHLGYGADAVANGLEVLEALQRIPYDVILMDCQMPEMDGYEATRHIRQAEQGTAHRGKLKFAIRIIAMTANAMQGDREKCLEAGMNDYISKPVEEEALQAALERWVPPAASPAEETAAATPPAGQEPAPKPDPALGTEAAAGAPPPEEPPVDIKRLTKLVFGNPKKLREMIDMYLTQANLIVTNLGSAVQAGNAAEVASLAHKCVGSSATCGMNAIVPSLRELERLGKEGKLDGSKELHEEARRQLDRIQQFLTAHMRTMETDLPS